MYIRLKYSAASAATLVLAIGLIAASAQFARAQDADWHNKASGSDIAVQPDKAPPLDLAGCWSGTVQDAKFGSGDGFLFFVQEGGKAVNGTEGGIETSGLDASGSLQGTIKKDSFSVKFHAKKCKVSFKGGLPAGDLVGSYSFKCEGESTHGSFHFTFDQSESSCL